MQTNEQIFLVCNVRETVIKIQNFKNAASTKLERFMLSSKYQDTYELQ